MHNEDGTTGLAGHKHSVDPVIRKQELLREGEYFRQSVAQAKAEIRYGARPDVILHGALDHATLALRTRADALLRPTGISVATLAPYGMTAFNFIRQRRLGKQAGVAAILLGVVGWYVHKRRSQQTAV
ncbi:hypothetical protein [Massilia agri]|uniref:DUF3618 domain-containing protein n=1 Tax=Massilia agri TaxID=1886785 RepID=A0ABT2AR78_9BURK|nr:hypothetical protein [Massilia agri]MCS0598750.1 hypothetical protein [Massilia agri]